MHDGRTDRTRRLAATLAVALVATLGACSSESAEPGAGGGSAGASTTAPAGTGAAAGRATADGITVEGAWARTSPAGAVNGAVYLRVTAAADDAITGAAVASDVAASAEVHETVTSGSTGGGMAAGTSPSMSMRQVERIALPAGSTVAFEPGGYHIMLLGLAAPLVRGSTINVTLSFEKAGPLDVEVPVADTAP
jgi:copper(I)-binding protein